jgi:murein DD-endopeptidase MepM/ murein hydrolase activator NlpD
MYSIAAETEEPSTTIKGVPHNGGTQLIRNLAPSSAQTVPGSSVKVRYARRSRKLERTARMAFRDSPSWFARLAVAIAGVTIAAACSSSTTSPTPQPTSVAPPVPAPGPSPGLPSSAVLLWPLAGRDGREWVINNYVDLEPSSGTLDYAGGSGSGAKTYNGHSGIDIDVPSFRWMDEGVSIVLAAASGVVINVHDNEPDRNTSCAGSANLVQVRHADGLIAIYGHLRRGSAAVSVGQQVPAGATLGVVGSSGCSTAPHLHFELRDPDNRVVDPFRNGLWAAPPIYDTTISLMDLVIAAGDMTLQQIKDPAPNVKSIPGGSVLGVGVSMAGGGDGDMIRLLVTAPTGATFADKPLTFTTAFRHSYWSWNTQLSPTPGVWTVSIFVNGVMAQSETVIVS